MLPSYEVMQAIYTADARERERRIRLLLGAWVSELEPAIACGPDHEVIGLSYGMEIVLRLDERAAS